LPYFLTRPTASMATWFVVVISSSQWPYFTGTTLALCPVTDLALA
jgi:hypothetical protein